MAETKTPEAAEQLKQQEMERTKEAQKHAGHVEGAQSVADAVKKVADAAVAEVQKAKASGPAGDFIVSGTAGGQFEASGPGNFGPSGTAKLNGVQLQTLEWGTMRVVGRLPADAKSGELTIDVDDKMTRRGYLKL